MIVTLSVLLIGTVVGVIYFWADFYIRGGVQVIKEDWYLKFERAFLPADLSIDSSYNGCDNLRKL